VTSVHPVAPAASATRAPTSLSRTIEATAASACVALACPLLIAVVSTPTPSAFVSTTSWPGRSPALVSRRSGWASPVTAMPYLGSGSSMVWPPAITKPASVAMSCPPASTSASSDVGSASVFQPTRLSANSGRPPIA
jgi:hypothetical protein